MQTIARTTSTFARMLTSVDDLLAGKPTGHESQLIVHGLAHATMMTLHGVRASESPIGDLNAINSRLSHASEILKILEGLSGDGASVIDPILSVRNYLMSPMACVKLIYAKTRWSVLWLRGRLCKKKQESARLQREIRPMPRPAA